MPHNDPNPTTESRTKVIFDLRDELTDEEISQFENAATEAGADSITEHFLNIALRTNQP